MLKRGSTRQKKQRLIYGNIPTFQTYLITDSLSNFFTTFSSNSLSNANSRQSTWLSTKYAAGSVVSMTVIKNHLRHLDNKSLRNKVNHY
jgi:hypothetical protein